nr:site-specific DNA-methyltransferase [Caldilineaceae bacterium]
EDLSRHDKWLCMMYPRLVLLRELLSDDGSLWMSIDVNEIANARSILDEIFGVQNFVDTVIWEKMYSPKSSARFMSASHEFILVFAKNANFWQRNLLARSAAQDDRYRNPDNDPRGAWKPSDLSARNPYSEGLYLVQTPSGRMITGPPKGRYWTISKEKFDTFDRDNRIWWGKNADSVPQLKRFLADVQGGVVPQTIWSYSDVGHTQEAKKEIVSILPDAERVFITPKPTRLIQRILQIATNPGDLVLDSFAGSGTTGHAVLQLNAAQPEAAPRRFILVEMESTIADPITAERLRRAVEGYTWQGQKDVTKRVPGLGGGFRYCTLGPTLFDAAGQIRGEVAFADQAHFVYFAETGQPLAADAGASPLLGVAGAGTGARAVYLLYNGILHDKTPAGGNVLTRAVLALLPAPPDFAGQRVVYAAACRLSATHLRQANVVFRQIPYELRVG